MSTILFPFTIAAGDPESAGPVMANFQAISSVVNGALEMGTNVLAGPASSQTGASNSAGSSQNGARADHQHAIQGFEQRTADPTTGNFVTRCYANTSTGKLRVCISAAGSGTYVTFGNVTAADLPNHATNHTTGSDPLIPPRVQLTRAGTGGISNGSITAVDFGTGNGTEVYDTDTMHDMTTHPTRITFAHAGVYNLNANCAWAANGTGSRYMSIQLNGAGTVLAADSVSGFGSGDNPLLSCSCDYQAAVNDYIELWVFQNSGGTLNLLGNGTSLVVGTRTAPMNFSARWVSG